MENVLARFQMSGREALFLGLKAATIIVAVVTIFYQDLIMIANDAAQSEVMSHILVIPFLLSYLIYRKRKMLRAVIPLRTPDEQGKTRHLPIIAGIVLSIVAILLYWHGSYTFTPLEYHMFALPIFISGLILILFNTQTLRQLAFPIVFLLFLMPPPSEMLYTLGSTLSVASSEAAYTIINSIGIPSTLTTEYGNPTIQITRPGGSTISFAVDIACSGIYSLIGFLIFAVFIAYLIRDKPWKKLALFLIGFSLIYLLNITRITTILLIGYHYGEETALQVFHLLGGWVLIFLGTLLLLTISERIFNTRIFVKSKECPDCSSTPKKNQSFCFRCGRILEPPRARGSRIDIFKIVGILVSVILLMSIQMPVFALTQTPAIVLIDTPTGQQVSTEILPTIPDFELRFWYRDTEFEAVAEQDMALVYVYSPANQSKKPVWAAIEIAPARSNLAKWEACVVYPEANQIDLKDIELLQNPPVIGRFFAFQYLTTNQTQAVLYWFESAIFTVNTTSLQKYVKISLIAYPESLEELPLLENQLTTFATMIESYWQPIKTWSRIALLLSQNGASVAAATSTLMPLLVASYVFEKRKQRKANTHAYQKLSKPNRQIINMVLKTEETATPTLRAIATTYKNSAGEPVEDKALLHRLVEAEKTGLVKSAIVSIQDEPTQIWRTQISEKAL